MRTTEKRGFRGRLMGVCMVLWASFVTIDGGRADTDISPDAPTAITQGELTITPSAGSHGSISPSSPVTVLAGGSATFTAEPEVGYDVDLWLLDGSVVQIGGDSYTVADVHEDHAIHVTFKSAQYQVTPSAGSHGSVSPSSPVTVPAGDSVGFSAEPEAGYDVDSWLLDGSVVQSGGNSYTLADVREDHMIHVTFKPRQHQITPVSSVEGWIDPAIPSYVETGSTLMFTAHPITGYKVDSWLLDGGVVQVGGNEYSLSNILADHTVEVVYGRLLSYSLGEIDFDEAQQFLARVVTNNSPGSPQPGDERVHVERVEGFDPDPKGVMVMHSLMDLNPASPDFGGLVNARAKGSFEGTLEDEIVVRFSYLFSVGGAGVELVVYLSDVPELLDHDDPLRDSHYVEVARLAAPPVGRPGSPGSDRLALFEQVVSTGRLNLAASTWIELELIEPAPSNSVTVDAWGTTVQCYGICLDINWDNLIDVADFLKVIGECGRPAVGERACCEGLFSVDGKVNSHDTVSWDWALRSKDRLLSLCKVPLVSPTVGVMAASQPSYSAAGVPTVRAAGLPQTLSDLLIVGKRGTSTASNKLKDRFYALGQDGTYIDSAAPSLDRCSVRLVRDNAGTLYLVNSEKGLVRLGPTEEPIIPPGILAPIGFTEPRYGGPATVSLGVQEDRSSAFGRPLLDAAFDADSVYVVPVVVRPVGGEPYTAAAKLRAGAGGSYEVVQLYDDPPLPGDNQYRDALRELEIDGAGHLYVLNAHSVNESDILWRYRPDGTVERLDLGRPDSENYCPDPTVMHVSDRTGLLYVASGREGDEFETSRIHGYSTQGMLAHARVIEILGMQQIADMTEDPATGCLWVLGFSMYNVPEYPNPTISPFYFACLARVEPGDDRAEAQSLYDPGTHDLAFPLSIIWTGR